MALFQVAVYVPGSKGAPSFVRLYQYPSFSGPQSALANKSFFKSDKVTMLWNKKGTGQQLCVYTVTSHPSGGTALVTAWVLRSVRASG